MDRREDAATDFVRAKSKFIRTYVALHDKADKSRGRDNILSADLHVQIASLCAGFVDANRHNLSKDELDFLRIEINSRVLLALNMRSLELSGLGDLSITLGAKHRLEDDLRIARDKALGTTARGVSVDDEDSPILDDDSDPRDGRGLYEFIAYEKLLQEHIPLIGYEAERAEIINAYYVLNDDISGVTFEDKTTRSSSMRRGTNIILYGPPGTGKTVTAKHTAIELRLNFVFANAENLVSEYRSKTEKNLRALYARMRRLIHTTKRNVLLLLDEADGLVKSRVTTRDLSTADHRLLSRFLTILEPNDGSDNFGIVSVFTTNYLSGLDEAFQRRCKTIFFGYIRNVDDRERIIRYVLGSSIADMDDVNANTIIAEMAKRLNEWVPGDFVRFKRDVVDAERLQAAIASFTVQRIMNGDPSESVPRLVSANLPKLSLTRIDQLTYDFPPITPKAKYDKYMIEMGVGASTRQQ